ncbi:enoyl-CoA hydratase/isomerase family protein [Aeromicrobium fastidiosum]|uniref:Enoyl-CoA hydratase/isomerase family protein n=1 Tax=Aeromicrobium fastidiosum TaxID=52699 RepID=A0A641ARR4_9ACTN|nr:enoyl-CoA hydratase/isomerase family protein [Aeromicrobium fastidiosum]KAA1379903.1 enoyl-CoA hydratase/isomerase family protein [Aeromicrobium fastidiosum]MBP2389409.1 2-(1,2-epoxy-1,2-dihydrophenyl)acetyl-CoA isomerase [Aeromicrobium fastidiosum]
MSDENLDVFTERVGTTAFLRVNRPEAKNSIHGTLMRDLIESAEAADADDDVRAIITTGEGKTWIAGGDKHAFAELTSSEQGLDLVERGYQGPVSGDWGVPQLSPNQLRGDSFGVAPWVRRFLDIGTPTIAAINGGVAAGGMAVSLMHDVRIASTQTRFAPTFVAMGVSPELGLSWFLPRIVGWPKALDILTRVKPIDADEALEIGLVEQVVEPHELRDAALARAEGFAQMPPVAVRMVKRLLRQASESTLEVQLEREWNNQTRLFGLTSNRANVSRHLDSKIKTT